MTVPRISEKVIQSQIVQALRTVGAAVYVIGRPPRKDAIHKGTGLTAGIPDLYVLLPASARRIDSTAGSALYDGLTGKPAHGLWIEVKAAGGKLRPQQREFATLCGGAGIPHLVGDLDVVLAYLEQHGYIRERAHYRRPA